MEAEALKRMAVAMEETLLALLRLSLCSGERVVGVGVD